MTKDNQVMPENVAGEGNSQASLPVTVAGASTAQVGGVAPPSLECLQRYDTPQYDDTGMQEEPEGEWVKFGDVLNVFNCRAAPASISEDAETVYNYMKGHLLAGHEVAIMRIAEYIRRMK